MYRAVTRKLRGFNKAGKMILKVDVDTPRGRLPIVELERRARIAQIVIVSVTDTCSPSGRGWHRMIEIQRMAGDGGNRLDETASGVGPSKMRRRSTALSGAPAFSALECVALHLLFGSDPIREAFNLHRARLVDSKQVSAFWRARWNTTYATRRGKEWRA